MFLRFNKIDLFREKLKKIPVSSIYDPFRSSDVNPGNSNLGEAFESARDFFRRRFLQRVQHDNREIYCHSTCALDTRYLEVVFQAMMDVVLRTCEGYGSGFMV